MKEMILNHHPDIKPSTSTDGLLFIGYWKHENSDSDLILPDPHDFVDIHWDYDERQFVVEYLKAGEKFESWRGSSYCRFGCQDVKMGYRCLTDGTFVWPEGFSHYLDWHHVKPSQKFLDHVIG